MSIFAKVNISQWQFLRCSKMADTTLLIKHADLLCTMEVSELAQCGAEISDAGLFARNGIIEQVGKTTDLPTTADRHHY